MAEITKPNFNNALWASGGAIVAPSDVKIATGWTAEVPPYQWENYSQNRQDQGIAHILQHGISVWDAVTEYQANKSYVQGSDGALYVAIQTHTSQNPVTDTTFVYWTKFAVGGLLNTQKFTASGTFTPTPGARLFRVRAQGGGGAGGGAQATSAGQLSLAGGGAAGGYSEGFFTLAQIGTSQVVVIGAGGTAATAGGTGGNGGSTTLGSLLTVPGGLGASAGVAVASSTTIINVGGASGTTPTGGSIVNMKGQSGSSGFSLGSGTISGDGGHSVLGTGGRGQGVGNNSLPGTGFGSGSSGAINAASQAARISVAGQDGVMLIEEFL